MSEDEKSAQIGEAVLTLERQKRELAHLETKIERVRLAYRTFAFERERWRVDASDSSKVFLIHPSPEERGLSAHLLSQSELAALIVEHQAAQAVLTRTREKLCGFGITGV